VASARKQQKKRSAVTAERWNTKALRTAGSPEKRSPTGAASTSWPISVIDWKSVRTSRPISISWRALHRYDHESLSGTSAPTGISTPMPR
jgi:hypothetical protein